MDSYFQDVRDCVVTFQGLTDRFTMKNQDLKQFFWVISLCFDPLEEFGKHIGHDRS